MRVEDKVRVRVRARVGVWVIGSGLRLVLGLCTSIKKGKESIENIYHRFL